MRRAGLWIAVASLVVLSARAAAYQLAPAPTALTVTLRHQAGGPRLVVTTLVALGLALAAAAGILWLASMAVRERQFGRSAPILRMGAVARGAILLFAATSFGFAALESWLHWRAGLGVHGLDCLIGPEHRNAVPLLAALSILAAACHGAVAHLLGWMRRTLALLLRRRPSRAEPPRLACPSAARVAFACRLALHRPRGPPAPASV